MKALRRSWHCFLVSISSTCCTSEGGLWAHRGKSAKPMFKCDMFRVLAFAEMLILHLLYSMFKTSNAMAGPSRALLLLRLWCATQLGNLLFVHVFSSVI